MNTTDYLEPLSEIMTVPLVGLIALAALTISLMIAYLNWNPSTCKTKISQRPQHDQSEGEIQNVNQLANWIREEFDKVRVCQDPTNIQLVLDEVRQLSATVGTLNSRVTNLDEQVTAAETRASRERRLRRTTLDDIAKASRLSNSNAGAFEHALKAMEPLESAFYEQKDELKQLKDLVGRLVDSSGTTQKNVSKKKKVIKKAEKTGENELPNSGTGATAANSTSSVHQIPNKFANSDGMAGGETCFSSDELDRMREMLKSSTEELDRARTKLDLDSSAVSERDTLLVQKKLHETQIGTLKLQVIGLQQRNSALTNSLDHSNQQLHQCHEKSKLEAQTHAAVSSERDTLSRENGKLKATLHEIRNDLAATGTKHQDKNCQLTEALQQIDSLRNEVQQMTFWAQVREDNRKRRAKSVKKYMDRLRREVQTQKIGKKEAMRENDARISSITQLQKMLQHVRFTSQVQEKEYTRKARLARKGMNKLRKAIHTQKRSTEKVSKENDARALRITKLQEDLAAALLHRSGESVTQPRHEENIKPDVANLDGSEPAIETTAKHQSTKNEQSQDTGSTKAAPQDSDEREKNAPKPDQGDSSAEGSLGASSEPLKKPMNQKKTDARHTNAPKTEVNGGRTRSSKMEEEPPKTQEQPQPHKRTHGSDSAGESSSRPTTSPEETTQEPPSKAHPAEQPLGTDDQHPGPANRTTAPSPAGTTAPVPGTETSSGPSISETNRPMTERMVRLMEVMNMKSCLEILEIGENVTLTESVITKAFRKGALKHHPDKVPGDKEGAEKRFRCVESAKEFLIHDVLGEAEVRRRELEEHLAKERAKREARREEMKESGFGLKGSKWA